MFHKQSLNYRKALINSFLMKKRINALKASARMRVNIANEIIDALATKYPHCFNRCFPRPLKIGIGSEVKDALLKQGYSKRKQHYALWRYTHSMPYLTAFEKHTHRYDLDGKRVEELKKEHKEFAKKTLQEFYKGAREKKFVARGKRCISP